MNGKIVTILQHYTVLKNWTKMVFSLFVVSCLVFFLSSPTPVRAQSENKAGINLAGEASKDTFKQAANIVGEGGWITVMVFSNGVSANCKGTLQEFFDLMSAGEAPKVNVIVRRWNQGGIPDPNEFAEMYANLNTYGQVVFDMPLNEPSLEGGTPEEVLNYINQSQQALQSRGILGNKIRMLSPMFNQFGGGVNFAQSLTNLDANFFNKFFGAAMGLYVLYDSSGNLAAPSDPARNGVGYREVLRQMGWNNYATVPVFAVETGVFVEGDLRPTYPPSDPADSIFPKFLDYTYNTWYADGNFWAATPLAYDPHKYPYDLYLLREPYSSQLRGYRRSGNLITYLPYGRHNGVGGVTDTSQCPARAAGCENPLNGPKDKGCYGAVVTKDSPDRRIWDFIPGIGDIIKKVIFKWGGSEQKIEVEELTIPIEKDLNYLLGYFPAGTPDVLDESALEHFQTGVLPKLTPPGENLQTLHQSLGSYLEDYSKGILDAESCKASGSENDVQISVPDVWGLANSAVRLAFSLVELPGSTPPDYAFNNGGSVLASRRVARKNLECKNGSSVAAAAYAAPRREASDTTITTTQTQGSTIRLARAAGECPYGPGKCPDKTDAPEKEVCISDTEGELDEDDEERMCSVDWQTFDCTPNTVFTCPNNIALSCNADGTVDCPVPACPGNSENEIGLFPKVSFLPDYTKYIKKTYKLFLTPGMVPKPLEGEGTIDWSYAGVRQGDGNDDDSILYPKLGTVECLEDYVKRVLSPPGHGLVPKENCFKPL